MKKIGKLGGSLVEMGTLQRHNHAALVFFNWLAVTFTRRPATWFKLSFAAEQLLETAWPPISFRGCRRCLMRKADFGNRGAYTKFR